MSERPTVGLIRELARDLPPVRRIPRLGVVTAAALALWLVGLGVESFLGGSGLRLRGDAAWTDPSYLAALVGLVFVALGASVAALEAAVPGRQAAARALADVAAAGLLIAVGAGLWALAQSGAGAGAEDLRTSTWCILRALMLGVMPTLPACVFIVHAAVRPPAMGAALALAGGIALGAAAVHATCSSGSPFHQLVAHTLAPVAAAALLSAPLGALLGRLGRSRMNQGT